MLTRTTPTATTRDTIDRTDEPTTVDRDSHAARGGAPSTGPDRRMVLPVQGMTCASCVAHVEKALAQVPGVRKVAVNLATESAAVEGVGLDAAALTGAVSAAGYEVPAQHLRFAVQGMTCASCVSRIEQALGAVPGVLKANVNLGTETATVDLVSGAASVRDLLAAIDAAGYQATLIADSGQGEAVALDATAGLRRDALLAIALALPLLLGSHLTLVGVDWMMPAWMQWLLATPVQFWCARRFYVAAARAVRARTGNMDLLVSLGTLAAYGLSLYLWIDGVRAHGLGHMQHLYFEAAAVVIALVLLGKWLEARAKRQTSEAIRLLAALRPDKALVLRDGQPVEVPIDDVRLGDLVVIRGGDRVPVDGLVRAGTSSIDESMLTGESLPVEKAVGDKVTAGSINGGGRLEVETTAVGAETVLSKIIRLVEDAQAAKAPIQRLVDKVAAVFVPVVLVIAFATVIGWLLAGRHLRARPHQRGQRAGDRLPVRARPRHADRDHRGNGRGRAARRADQGRRGARTRPADRGRRVRQDRHPDHRQAARGGGQRARRGQPERGAGPRRCRECRQQSPARRRRAGRRSRRKRTSRVPRRPRRATTATWRDAASARARRRRRPHGRTRLRQPPVDGRLEGRRVRPPRGRRGPGSAKDERCPGSRGARRPERRCSAGSRSATNPSRPRRRRSRSCAGSASTRR